MGIPGSANLLLAAGEAQAYQLQQSLRFNDDDSAYLQLNGGTSPTNGKIGTYSVWVKRSEISGNDNSVFGSSPASTLYNDIKFDNNDRLYYRQYHSSGGGYTWTLTTAARYRDPSAWLHIFVAVDTTQATSSDRVKMYVNGAQITEWHSESYPGQNITPLGQEGNYAVGIGRLTTTFTQYFDGYMAEYHHVDGTAHEPADFGEYDDNGVWRPIEVTGITYGNRGWYLTFDPTAANGIGHDHSGNGNHFTANNFTTSGTGTDVMSDTPTKNWCTLNPLEVPGGTAPVYENGNLTLRNSTNYLFAHGVGTFGLNSGKWYFETSGDESIYVQIGFLDSSQIRNLTGGGGVSGANISWHYQSNGIIRGLSSTYTDTGLTAASTAGDIMGLAIDFDAGEASWYVNGTQVGSTVDFSSYLSDSRIWYPVVAVTNEGTDVTNVNFGQRDFAYTPPTGFKALNTSNLPEPDIADGSDYFNTLLYTGDGTAPRSLTGVGFQPDWVWIKARDQAWWHVLGDSVRGSNGVNGLNLNTNDTAFEGDENSGHVESWDSDGFTVEQADSGTSPLVNVNNNNSPYVAWNWKAGGTASSNTAGSITSTVSASPSSGFSIATYTGNGTAGATIGHGLGVAPSFIVTKRRDAASVWNVYHGALGATKVLYLNQTSSQQTDSSVWNNTAPSSAVFTVGTDTNINTNTGTYVAYCFAEVEGYSKFGSYTGNGSTDGPFIYTGFKPAFVLVKRSSSSGTGWIIIDNTRDDYNPGNHELNAEDPQAELTAYERFDLLSNGFKQRSTFGANNLSGATYIYAAFASSPLGGDGVSPATAR